VKFFVDSRQAADASKVTLSFHCIYAKEIHQVKELFQNSTGKILSRRKFILQLINDVRMKKINWRMLRPNPHPSAEIYLDNMENVMEQDATRCM